MTRTIQGLAACAALVLASGELQAQHQQTYPWDNRPKKCLMEGAPQVGPCAPVDDYPSPERVNQYIQNLYYNDTFRLLERYLTGLAASGKRFQDGQHPEEVLLRAFTNLMIMGAQHGNAVERNAAWRREAPGSKFVLYAEAARLRALAWNARGTGYAHTVSPESWELFALRLQEAERVLLDAPVESRESPAWHIALLAIAMDSDRVRSNPHEVFTAAVKRWPTHAMLFQLPLGRMIPKWGGSWDQVESFILKSTEMQPTSEGKSLYARLYIHLIAERSAHESKMDWKTMQAGFDDAIARFPDPKYRNLYASYACLAKDKTAFNKAIARLPKQDIQPGWWLDGNSYDACMRWAGV
jgi:hypothetical protein